MATFSRKVTVDWSGSIMEGKGSAKAGTGAFTLPVTFPSRVGEPAGQTSPEELMAASHAACYAMALNATLGRKQASAARTLVTATVT
ncbi:MAG: OsmC family protein, partial [Acidobacteria bacterium]|nr:OsmC family protein [Acidobacteriota bacterium]